MKRLGSLLLITCVIFSISIPVSASSIVRFEKVRTYQNQFTDVPESSVHKQHVQIVYEYGLMDGISDTEFGLSGNFSVADAIVAACRLHMLYNHDAAEPFFENRQDYINYAIQNKIITDETDYSYDEPVTRATFALLISNATSKVKFEQINQVWEGDIPGITSGSPYHDAVYTLKNAGVLKNSNGFQVFRLSLTLGDSLGIEDAQGVSNPSYDIIFRLYQAGILKGNDAYGTFSPNESISRASAAVILSRTIEPAMREKFVLKKRTDILVPLDKLANRSSLQKKASDAALAQAYEEARKIVEPLVNLSREAQLCGIVTALRVMSEDEVAYSTSAPHYNDPYGFFVLHTASCAGCTRAAGLCLNILGIPYEHVNENQYSHQWARVNVNGAYWICDPYGVFCGPEKEPYKHPDIT